ncbi:hypothetical protein HOR96_gp44 [Agrobacterium phage Atu_ph02]|uniref:Uncharacterized protein n=1 Tax=Agrobacterium phage Atu_ph02 TaxID=2024261 RepID=A0A2L0UYX3_9CAUD|nr:hypothetical protein HOR96_gp44 [Agrobacterium phage Atu_ph02]AUZ94752.1 hypothetical protein [Agrobacterium phage Atu_ph02]
MAPCVIRGMAMAVTGLPFVNVCLFVWASVSAKQDDRVANLYLLPAG